MRVTSDGKSLCLGAETKQERALLRRIAFTPGMVLGQVGSGGQGDEIDYVIVGAVRERCCTERKRGGGGKRPRAGGDGEDGMPHRCG